MAEIKSTFNRILSGLGSVADDPQWKGLGDCIKPVKKTDEKNLIMFISVVTRVSLVRSNFIIKKDFFHNMFYMYYEQQY